MAIEFTEITENSPDFTGGNGELPPIGEPWASLYQRIDHLDEMIHDISRKVDAMHTELEAARPLLERAMRSKVIKYAAGLRDQTWQT